MATNRTPWLHYGYKYGYI